VRKLPEVVHSVLTVVMILQFHDDVIYQNVKLYDLHVLSSFCVQYTSRRRRQKMMTMARIKKGGDKACLEGEKVSDNEVSREMNYRPVEKHF
jgi:hypothetical protein